VLRWLRGLSPRDEFVIVVVVAFGPFAVSSIAGITPRAEASLLSESDLKYLLVYELVVLTALAFFLHARDWTFERIGLAANARESLIGIGLALITQMVSTAVWSLATFGSQQVQKAGEVFNPLDGSIDPAITIAVSIVNPIFEEAFLCGYVISALKERVGPWTAINVSVGFRLVWHLYQGIVGVIFIVPFGLVFAYWYARQGRLWPLIVAHVLFDFIALIAYARP
jgi:membrane protease YdiL (CAAX protease family)